MLTYILISNGAPCSPTSWCPIDLARQPEQQELLVHLPPGVLLTWRGSQNGLSSLLTYLLVSN
jgi:hypothetical protein